jgi:hypothetical protein
VEKVFSASRLWISSFTMLALLGQASIASPGIHGGAVHHLKGGMRSLLNAMDGEQSDQSVALTPDNFAPGGGPADPERPRYAMTYSDEVVRALDLNVTGVTVAHVTVMGNGLGLSLVPSGVPGARGPMLMLNWRLGP